MGLIVHIKLNGGVMLEDTAARRTSRTECLQRAMARFLHGRWDEEDRMAPQCTFEQHLNRRSCPNTEHIMTHFLEHLRDTNHVHAPQAQALYNLLLARLGSKRIFDSAMRLFDLALNSQSLPAAQRVHIVLRSFGSDLVQVCNDTGLPWVFAAFSRGKLATQHQVLSTPQAMNDFFVQHPLVAIEDEYPRWVAHTFSPHYGMPFPSDTTNQAVFFATNKKSSSITPTGPGPHVILGLNTLKALESGDYLVQKLRLHLLYAPCTPNPLYVSQ